MEPKKYVRNRQNDIDINELIRPSTKLLNEKNQTSLGQSVEDTGTFAKIKPPLSRENAQIEDENYNNFSYKGDGQKKDSSDKEMLKRMSPTRSSNSLHIISWDGEKTLTHLIDRREYNNSSTNRARNLSIESGKKIF